MPGDTTPKTLTITNTGEVDAIARVCLSEEWTSSNDDTLLNEVNGERMAIINIANPSDWAKKDDCYEYVYILEPNETTSSFIESVTFNPNATADLNCTTTTLNGTTTSTCESTGDGYDNATYKLTLRVETVQANKASAVWGNENTKYTANLGTGVVIGSAIPNTIEAYTTIAETRNSFDNRLFYLKHIIENGVVTGSYVEFIITKESVNDNPEMTEGIYSLRGSGATHNDLTDLPNDDSQYFETNKNIMQSAFGESNCSDNGRVYTCFGTNFAAHAYRNGIVSVSDGDSSCEINIYDNVYCVIDSGEPN